ncbi:hypothetical protein [Mesorhizobium sp. M0898]|uniref:hypothetical protein n=1 Tax=Mesorhizobium sp. M0898 TaxID=2957020 RepID=UPI00333AB370
MSDPYSPENIAEIKRDLTGHLVQIFELVGAEATLKIAAKWGGGNLYVPLPKFFTPKSALATVVGYEIGLTIVQGLGFEGEKIEIHHGPLGLMATARRKARRLLSEGRSVQTVAREVRVGLNTVKEWKRQLRAANNNARQHQPDNDDHRLLIKAAGTK